MRAKQLFTIGYEGAELSDFLATLIASGITQILDVRDVPLSRKRGFSKNSLSNALSAEGIVYHHLKGLGDPKPGRDAARRGEYALFNKIYKKHLQTECAQSALDIALHKAGQRISCLLCFERAHEHCHRSIVAAALIERSGFDVKHIGVRKGISTYRGGRYGAIIESGVAFGGG